MDIHRISRRACSLVLFITMIGMQNAPPNELTAVRRLTFHVVYDSRTRFVTPSAGYLSNGGSSGWSTRSGPHVHREPSIDIEIVAAPADGSLAADVSEVDGARSGPPVRVGVRNNALTYKTDAGLSEEERVLLHFLARDLIGPARVSEGEDWHDIVHLDGTNVDTEFRINHVDPVTKTFDAALHGTTLKRFGAADVAMSGTMTYDLPLLVPVSLHLMSFTRRLTPSLDTQITANVDATLRGDSFNTRSLAPQGEPTGS